MAEQSVQGASGQKSSLTRPYPPPRQRLVLLAHFTGYRLQTTATTFGLLGHKRPLSLPTGSWLHGQGAITPAFLSEKGYETDVDICDQKEGTCGLRAAPFGWHSLSFMG